MKRYIIILFILPMLAFAGAAMVQLSTSNGVAAVTVVDAPAGSTTRTVFDIIFYNTATTQITFTLSLANTVLTQELWTVDIGGTNTWKLPSSLNLDGPTNTLEMAGSSGFGTAIKATASYRDISQ